VSAPAWARLPPALPDATARGRPWTRGELTGRAFAALAPELEARVEGWWRARAVPEGEVLKAPDVFRLGALVIKFFPQASLLGWIRPARALRSAERYFWCLPLRSPRPLLAVAKRFARPSLLVREHLEGASLREVWLHDARAEAALAPFLAAMERHGVVHGDLHPQNLLWDGKEWVLLDVDGLRHGLHDARRALCGQWARLALYLADEGRVRALFERARPRLAWGEVEARLRELRAARGGVPPP
jgi:hypothetical protein